MSNLSGSGVKVSAESVKYYLNKMPPLISVILPAFNAEKYISDSVNSILAQSFTDFELIIINDGSTDATLTILEKFRHRDSRVTIVSRENKGLVFSLNEGLDLASGKWIARMDADDIALPNRFTKQLEWLAHTGADICGSGVRYFGTFDKRVLMHPKSDEAIKAALLFGCPFAHPTVMMKTELVKKLRYDKAWEKCEDYDLWERAARAGWVMTNVPDILLMYRIHEAQISTATSTKQLELTQKIRRRYWEYVSVVINLKKECVEDVLKLREPSLPKANMNNVDYAIGILLEKNEGEARETIFYHATRLYFRAASSSLDVALRWNHLNKKYGRGRGLYTIIKLALISFFKIEPNRKTFAVLKKGMIFLHTFAYHAKNLITKR